MLRRCAKNGGFPSKFTVYARARAGARGREGVMRDVSKRGAGIGLLWGNRTGEFWGGGGNRMVFEGGVVFG